MQNYSRIANNEITAAVSRILPVPREAPQVPNSVVIGERKGGPKQNRLEVLERRQLFKLSEILSFPMEASKIFQTCILSFPLPRHRPTSIVFSRENGAGRLVSSGRPVHYHIFHKVQIFRAFPRPDPRQFETPKRSTGREKEMPRDIRYFPRPVTRPALEQ